MKRFAGPCLLLACLLLAVAAHGKPFLRDNDRVLFIGDNATLTGSYARLLEVYATLRYPTARVHWYNTGWTDTALLRRDRLASDLALLRPTVVIIAFGMNDGGFAPLDNIRLRDFRAGMSGILDQLRKRHVRAVLLTPTGVDPAGDRLERIHRDGWNYHDTLAVYAREIVALGKRRAVPVADAFTLLRDLQEKMRKDDPAATLYPDGIYPNPAGHAAIAYALVKAMGAASTAARLTIDAASGKVVADRCRVNDLRIGAESLAFTRVDDALPMLLLPGAALLDRYLPLQQELNRYPFAVTGLQDGCWTLKVEEVDLGSYQASELAAGIDLAARPGPWQALARQVDALVVREFGAFCQDWVYLLQYRPEKELQKDYATLVQHMLAVGDVHQQARMNAVAVAQRNWRWTLTLTK